MEFRLLGEFELEADSRLVDAGVPQQQMVLAQLVVEARRPVSIETLIDRLWEENPPVEARGALYSHLSRIRRTLRRATVLGDRTEPWLERRPSGYVLHVDPDRVDVHKFQHLITSGRDSQWGDHARAAVLRQALGLWRGQPLAGLSGQWIAQMRGSWHRWRLDAVIHWAQLELTLGNTDAVIRALPDLITEYPFAEPLAGLLMRALHAAGRDAEALNTYAAVRLRLTDDLGAEPGNELRHLHEAILQGDDQPTDGPPHALITIPSQLPLDVYGFTGRDHELRYLNTMLPTSTHHSTAATVVSVTGGGGTGKTALAVHWAHQVHDRFPDGQLYIDLHGYALDQPLRPDQVLAQFLRALGVRPEQVPAELPEAAALYRSMLTGKRILVVLDNANSADQVRPLLPGSPTCLVVITSRNLLESLTAVNGARRLSIDVLPMTDAVALLVTVLGTARVAAEPDAAAELARTCACLPLALRITASQLDSHPARRIADHLAELRSRDVLRYLHLDDDPQAAVQATFDLSYGLLKPEVQRLFRLMGLVPGYDITSPAAAVLIGGQPDEADRLLTGLCSAHLVEEHLPCRYTHHDLLRRYALQRTIDEDSEHERVSALQRLLQYFLHTANAAADQLYPHLMRLPSPSSAVRPDSVRFASHAEALGWLDGERSNLVAAVQRAHQYGMDEMAWLLGDALRGYLELRRLLPDWFTVAQTALAAANSHPLPQAAAHLSLGRAHHCTGHYRQAEKHFIDARSLSRQTGWLVGEAAALNNLGITQEHSGQWEQALRSHTESAALHEHAGQPPAPNALLNLAHINTFRGQLDQAINQCQQALAIATELGLQANKGCALYYLSVAAHLQGRLDDALGHCTQALDIYRAIGSHGDEAEIYVRQADILRDSGRNTEALSAARTALTLSHDSSDPYVEVNAGNAMAFAYTTIGEHRNALKQHTHALQLARSINNHHGEGQALVGLALGNLNTGHHDEALEQADRAVVIAEHIGHIPLTTHALIATARIHLHCRRRDQARDTAQQALALAHNAGYRLLEADIRSMTTDGT